MNEWSSYSALSWQWGLDRSEQFKLRSPALLRQGPRLTLKKSFHQQVGRGTWLCLAMLWDVSPSSPKYVAPCGHWLFWSKKCHRAALISPSKRQKRHRGPDRPKIQPFLRVASPNFLNSQSPLVGQTTTGQRYKNFSLWFIFWTVKHSGRLSIWILGRSLGSFKTFNSFVSEREISMFIQVWRGFYICLFTTA